MTGVLVVAAVLVVVCFAGGTLWNVRKGSAAMRWMHGGLPLLGERTTVRWLGSTLVELRIQHALDPFERAAVVVFLEPRDLPWMWAISRSRGRRDTLIVRGILRQAPRVDLEALDHASWSGREAVRRLKAGDWLVREPAAPGELALHYKTAAAVTTGEAMLDLARSAGLTVQRLSLLRGERAFQLHLALPPAAASAADVFGAVRALAQRATV